MQKHDDFEYCHSAFKPKSHIEEYINALLVVTGKSYGNKGQ